MKVAICITAREGGTSLHHLVPSLLATIPTLVRAGHKVRLSEVEGGELHSSRAEVIADARRWGADRYYMQDADMSVQPQVLLAMLQADRGAMLCPYARRHHETDIDVECMPPPAPLRVHLRNGIRTVEVEGGGLGCCLLNADIIEEVWVDCQEEGREFLCGKSLQHWAVGLFDNVYETTPIGRLRKGEDWSFWYRVKRHCTLEALCDLSTLVIHDGKTVDFARILKDQCEARACHGCGA